MKLMLGGDAMLGRLVNEVVQQRGAAYPLEPLFPLTRTADLFFVNLECAISAKALVYRGPPKAFYFRADPIAAESLRLANVKLVSLANNHALDADGEGLLATLDILKAHGIVTVGAGRNLTEARRPARLEGAGLRLGVLAACDHQADFAATDERPGIWHLDLRRGDAEALLAAVGSLAREVDGVVVSLHWQPNWVPRVAAETRALARALIAAGARVVWGHSPHHLQGVEWSGKSVVLYSSGGLVDDYALEAHYRNDLSLLFALELSRAGVERVLAYPLKLDFARTRLAGGEDLAWLQGRFPELCREVGSRATFDEALGAFAVAPTPTANG